MSLDRTVCDARFSMTNWQAWVLTGAPLLAGLAFLSVAPRALNVKQEERTLCLLSALFFFLILCGYFLIRPVRDAMGVSRGMDELRWLFVVTSVVSLVVALIFGGVVERTNRRRFIPAWYIFVMVCLLGFAGLLARNAALGGSLVGAGADTGLARNVGYVFFVWLSVINLFMTSVFWAFMVDIFDLAQGKRLFAFIGAGGTMGSIAGSGLANLAGGAVDSPYLPTFLMLGACTMFAAAVGTMLRLDRMTARASDGAAAAAGPPPGRSGASGSRGATFFWGAAKLVFTSPYLLGIGLWIIFMAVSNTMIYFAQANLILAATDTFSQRVESFALFDWLAQAGTLVVQIFVTTRLVRWLGVGWTLALLALVTLAGFAALAVWPVLGVIAIFQAVHRATRHAVARPVRETLFSVVTRREKYQAKPLVDVFLYRGGDVAGVGVDSLLSVLGRGIAALTMLTAPLVGMWIALSLGLARAQARRAAEREALEPEGAGA